MYTAMKSGEKEKANTLRNIMSKLKDKQIEKREALSDEKKLKYCKPLLSNAKSQLTYKKGGRSELVAIEKQEMDIINSYLPKMMSEDAIKDIVKSVIDSTGASMQCLTWESNAGGNATRKRINRAKLL